MSTKIENAELMEKSEIYREVYESQNRKGGEGLE